MTDHRYPLRRKGTQSGFPLTERDYLTYLKGKVERLRVPLSGDLAITHRCNLRCVHCYVGSGQNHPSFPREELTTAQWLTLLDDVTKAGCLFLLITGGEPLLRDDFVDIYRYAKRKGLLVTVFTNGTSIRDEVLDVWEDLPPQTIEISLYGATAATYETITGIRGSYERCVRGIERLLERRLNVRLKTVLMTDNRHEFEAIKAMALRYGVKFRMDAEIFPRFNGDKTPLERRVSPEEAVDREFADQERSLQWIELFERSQGLPRTGTLYTCGAGMTHFHVDPYGHLKPCLMVQDLEYDLGDGGFLEGWKKVMPRIRKRKIPASSRCEVCSVKVACGFCPAFFRLENSDETVYSDYLCSMGQLRYQRIMKASHE